MSHFGPPLLPVGLDHVRRVHNDMKSHARGTVSFGRGSIMSKSSKQKLNTKRAPPKPSLSGPGTACRTRSGERSASSTKDIPYARTFSIRITKALYSLRKMGANPADPNPDTSISNISGSRTGSSWMVLMLPTVPPSGC